MNINLYRMECAIYNLYCIENHFMIKTLFIKPQNSLQCTINLINCKNLIPKIYGLPASRNETKHICKD